MATLIVRLEIDPVTRKKNVLIKYDSDSDALPMEHEEAHKRLVEQLLASGAVKPGDLGDIRIEREAAPTGEAPKQSEAPTAAEPVPVKTGR